MAVIVLIGFDRPPSLDGAARAAVFAVAFFATGRLFRLLLARE
jgi:hypothetical protein